MAAHRLQAALPPQGGVPLACCVDISPPYLPKARHSLRMLLLPLGIDPRWVARADLPEQGIYYGARPGGLGDGVLCLPLAPDAAAFFEGRASFAPERASWEGEGATRRPVLFAGAEGPDLVASAFFWLSGWQEYAVPVRDVHGRFPHHASLQAALGVTTQPPVDAYREAIGARLRDRGVRWQRREWGEAAWVLCPTHDVDYLRKWRPGMIYREAVLYLVRNARAVSPPERLRRFGAFLRQAGRPGDVYRAALDRMPREVARRGGTATYFFKTGAHGDRDVAYALGGRYGRARLAALRAAGFEIGLHPSYHAHTHEGYLRDERDALAALAGAPPRSVRQHYLRYDLPATPRLHEAAGFAIDSSLGFAEHEGFRHGTCLPFQPYDLHADRPLGVWEMPLALMESALFNRRGCSPEEARAATQDLLETCRRFGGAAVVLWHNVLWDELDYPGWGRHFTDTLDDALARGARLASLEDALRAWGATRPRTMDHGR